MNVNKKTKILHTILRLKQNGFNFYHSDMNKSTFGVYLKNVLQIDTPIQGCVNFICYGNELILN